MILLYCQNKHALSCIHVVIFDILKKISPLVVTISLEALATPNKWMFEYYHTP